MWRESGMKSLVIDLRRIKEAVSEAAVDRSVLEEGMSIFVTITN